MHSRKKEHIQLALASEIGSMSNDKRFYYEPLFCATSDLDSTDTSLKFLGHEFAFPLWISSMTGGTKLAKKINENMARACLEFGLGMGLGSCRSILESDNYFEDFNVRGFMGDRPLYANIGIAQLESLLKQKELSKLEDLIGKLSANGLVVHINPLQEFIQPEGDVFYQSPLETLEVVTQMLSTSIIVKEVGQGMGPKSLSALAELNIDGIEFSSFGGTNFSDIELQRSEEEANAMVHIGHTAVEMIEFSKSMAKLKEKEIIISGGVKNSLDGYYLTQLYGQNCLYAQAGSILKHAMDDYQKLATFLKREIQVFKLAKRILTLRGDI